MNATEETRELLIEQTNQAGKISGKAIDIRNELDFCHHVCLYARVAGPEHGRINERRIHIE
jgi:hypothetical protein